MQNTRPSFFSRTYLINPKFQWRVIFFGVSIGGFVLALTYVFMQYFFSSCEANLISAGIPAQNAMFDFLKQQRAQMDSLFIVIICFTLVVSTVIGVFLSHRVAGPIYRITKHLQGIATGEPAKPLRFRDGDYFMELADAYNATLAKGPSVAPSHSIKPSENIDPD